MMLLEGEHYDGKSFTGFVSFLRDLRALLRKYLDGMLLLVGRGPVIPLKTGIQANPPVNEPGFPACAGITTRGRLRFWTMHFDLLRARASSLTFVVSRFQQAA